MTVIETPFTETNGQSRQENRERFGQIAILLGTTGLIIALIGLFPSITGVEARSGVGVLQILLILLD